MIQKLIAQLSVELELDPPLEPAMPDVYVLPLDEETSVTISSSPEAILIASTFAPVPAIKKEEFYEELLNANLFGQGTGGAILGLTEDGKALTLSLPLEKNIDFPSFLQALESFIDSIDFWYDEAINRQ